MDTVRSNYGKAALRVADWIEKSKLMGAADLNFASPQNSLLPFMGNGCSLGDTVKFCLVPDWAGEGADVTDIRIRVFRGNVVVTLNISLKCQRKDLKGRSPDLKHNRINEIGRWIGITGSRDVDKYVRQYEGVWSSFERFREITR